MYQHDIHECDYVFTEKDIALIRKISLVLLAGQVDAFHHYLHRVIVLWKVFTAVNRGQRKKEQDKQTKQTSL